MTPVTDKNGTTGVVVPAQQSAQQATDTDQYRPRADRARVYAEIERALRDVVWESTHQATQFVSLSARDRDEAMAVRYGHLVDADECLELAMTYLGQLKQFLSHRIAVTDDDPVQRY